MNTSGTASRPAHQTPTRAPDAVPPRRTLPPGAAFGGTALTFATRPHRGRRARGRHVRAAVAVEAGDGIDERAGREDRLIPGPGELSSQQPALIIGREAGLARLRALVDPVPQASQVLLVTGEAGMGKTVLLADADPAGSRSQLVPYLRTIAGAPLKRPSLWEQLPPRFSWTKPTWRSACCKTPCNGSGLPACGAPAAGA